MTAAFRTQYPTKELAEAFAEDSESEGTFYGFSDDELENCDEISDLEDEEGAMSDLFPTKQKATSKSSSPRSFTLRVALRTTHSTQQPTDDEEDAEKEAKNPSKIPRPKKERHVKFEDVEMAVMSQAPPSEGNASDSAEDVPDTFLDKREKNIKANKAMLAQLMADLQKMPGGVGFLKKQVMKGPKEKSSRAPRSGGEKRKNPERASRRQSRSMGGVEDTPAAQKEKLELSLEEELLEVRRAPQRRSIPRPNQCKPHDIRLVEEITEDELELVADNMTDKVYDRVAGSTCHQCRQKTIDTKTCCRDEDCRGIQGQFCGPCLRNRYGEDVRKALLDPEWRCPPCRGICNCSFCRQREGRCPTGILFPLAQYHGFSDVHSYLLSLRNKLKSENDVVL